MIFVVPTDANRVRLLVPRARFDEAVDAVRTTLESIPYGDPTDPPMMMGPLINARQREKVARYVDDAVAAGAKAVIGGQRPAHLDRGYFYEPTLLVGVDEHAPVAQDERFDPVLVVLPHDGNDDVVPIANDSIFGLSGSVVGADRERALGVARRIRARIGREMGVAGLEEFLERTTFAEPE